MKGEKLQMRINLLSSFAAGILISTTICGAVYFTDKSDAPKAVSKTSQTSTSKEKVQLTESEMKDKLAAAGYVVQTKAEYDKKINNAKASVKATPKKDSKAGNTTAQKTVYRTVITVTDGMTSIDVGRMLAGAKIIQKDAFSFSKDIEARKIENKLKPGSFEVDSSMSYDQVISTIFK